MIVIGYALIQLSGRLISGSERQSRRESWQQNTKCCPSGFCWTDNRIHSGELKMEGIYEMATELLGGQRQRLKVEFSGAILKATQQNWATKEAAASLVIMRSPTPEPHTVP